MSSTERITGSSKFHPGDLVIHKKGNEYEILNRQSSFGIL